MKIIAIIIFFTYNLLNGQIRSDSNLTTGFGPVAMESDSAGNIHLSFSDGDNNEIYYQLFDSLFNPKINRIKISSKANVLPGPPKIEVNGSYIMTVWDAMLWNITRWRIFGRILNINGDTLSSELRIDSADASISVEKNPVVVKLNDTTFMAIWSGNAHYGEALSVVGRKINIHTGPFGNEIYMMEDLPPFKGGVFGAETNSKTNEIFCLFGGDFYDDTLNNPKIYFRRYDLNGNPLISSTLFLRDSSNYKIWEPHLSYNPLGKYTVIWSKRKDSVWSIKLNLLDLNGSDVGDVIQVNSESNIVSTYPSMGIDFNSNGEAIVVWESVSNGKVRIYGQRFTSDGKKLGNNFRISTEPINSDHYWPSVQLLNKNIITIWSSYANSSSESQLWGNVLDFNKLVTSIKEDENKIPIGFLLNQNYPNPFNPSITISYVLPYQSLVEIIIYDIMGREIRSYIISSQSAGYNKLVWDGRNNSGNTVTSGVYFYKISINSLENNETFSKTAKMLMLK